MRELVLSPMTYPSREDHWSDAVGGGGEGAPLLEIQRRNTLTSTAPAAWVEEGEDPSENHPQWGGIWGAGVVPGQCPAHVPIMFVM